MSVATNVTRFYFIRHGQTEANRSQIFHADESIPITDLGIQQAVRAADVLADQPLSGIVSSPYFRVQQTLAPLVVLKPNLDNRQLAHLGERSFKGLDGRRFRDVVGEDASDAAWKTFWHQTHQGVEPLADFYDRVSQALGDGLTQDNLLFAAHGGVLIAIAQALGIEPGGRVHANALPILFERQTPQMPWHMKSWDWQQRAFIPL